MTRAPGSGAWPVAAGGHAPGMTDLVPAGRAPSHGPSLPGDAGPAPGGGQGWPMARLLARKSDAAPGLCAAAAALWGALRFDAADPFWPDRDRCVLGLDDGPALLPALLQLTGHAAGAGQPPGPADDAGEVPGQAGAAGPGERAAQAEAYGLTAVLPGVALATAMGMALAERVLAARFGRSLVDHRTWVLACGTELDGSLGREAASLAGELRLDRLTVLHEDTDGTAEERLRRFAALGWSVRLVEDGAAGLAAALATALEGALRGRKPALIACRVAPGHAPDAAARTDGATDAAARTGTVADAAARIGAATDEAAVAAWLAAGRRGATPRRGWLRRLALHARRGEFERVMAGRLPEDWQAALAALRRGLSGADGTCATTDAGTRTLDALAGAVPELLAGVAGSVPALPPPAAAPTITAGAFEGRFVAWGLREGGMAAALNGVALHGGLIPCAQARFAAADGLRPALHQAALLRRRVVHVLVQDEEVPPGFHLAAGQLASLRAVPDLHVLRPADAVETVECWELALRRRDGPSLLVLYARPGPTLRTDAADGRCARGGYVLAEAQGPRAATLIASGPELAVAMAARTMLAAAGVAVAAVSLPCWELFARQDEAYRASVLGAAPRFGVEAAQGFGWERWLGEGGIFIGAGDSAQAWPLPTAEAVCEAVRRVLGERRGLA